VHILGIEFQRHPKVGHLRSYHLPNGILREDSSTSDPKRLCHYICFFFGSENVAHAFSADEFITYFITLATRTACLLRYLTFLIVIYRVILFNFFVLMRIVLRNL
jgi:hypothetical protein